MPGSDGECELKITGQYNKSAIIIPFGYELIRDSDGEKVEENSTLIGRSMRRGDAFEHSLKDECTKMIRGGHTLVVSAKGYFIGRRQGEKVWEAVSIVDE